MLATIPITKTSASRLTPELRDKAAFGAVFSDHMLVADYANGKWGEPRIIPYGQQLIAAAPACAHYGQGIFEGFKAFPRPNGGAVVFRPDANHARMAKTCQRMAMPEVPASIFIDGTLALVQLDRNWIPEVDNSALYVRPVLFATGESLGVRPSETFRFIIETCPSAPYFSGSVDLLAEETYVRAFPGPLGRLRHKNREITVPPMTPDSPLGRAGALLVFRAADKSTAESFAKADPSVKEGLVKKWTVRPWTRRRRPGSVGDATGPPGLIDRA